MEFDNSKLVSIVVPVYNVEAFLEHCIKSLLEQTYSNIEVILVDDGSTDSSGSICDEWKKKDSRVVVYHQPNLGVSVARNNAIKMAQGEYLCFVDSDDFVTKTFIEDFIKTMVATNADFTLCDVVSAKLADGSLEHDVNAELTPKDCASWLSNPISREYVLMVIPCNKIFKKELFDNYSFVQGKRHEDEFMINHMLYNIQKAAYISKANYIYRNNESGFTSSHNAESMEHFHVIEAYEERIKMSLERNNPEFAATTVKWALLKLAHFYDEGGEKMKNCSVDIYNEMYAKYFGLLTKKQQKKYKLFTITPGLFCKMFL